MIKKEITFSVNQLERGPVDGLVARAFLRPLPDAAPSVIRDDAIGTIGMVRVPRARQSAAPSRWSDGN